MPEDKSKDKEFQKSSDPRQPQQPTPAQQPKKEVDNRTDEEKNRDSHLDYNRGS